MRPWIAAAALVAGFAAGFAVGGAVGGPPEATVPRRELESVQRKLDEANARAQRVEQAPAAQERRPVRDPGPTSEPPANGAAKDPAPAADRAARVRELVAKSAERIEQGDGGALLEILRSLADLPPEGRAAAMDLALRIQDDVGGPQALGIDAVSFYSTLGDPGPSDLLVWSLANPSPPAFRALAAWSLPWVVPQERAIEEMTAALVTETDVGVQQALVASLGRMRNSRVDAALAAIFRDRTRDPSIRVRLTLALATSRDPQVVALLSAAAADDPDESVRAAARSALQLADPPADGYALTFVPPGGAAAAAGLRVCDILVSYDGRPVKSTEALRDAIDAAKEAPAGAAETVPVVLVREGRESTIAVPRGRLDVKGHAVGKR